MAVMIWYYVCEGVHDFLMSLETNDAEQKRQKAAEKYRQHQITQFRQQITDLLERRNQLKKVVDQLQSNTVSCYVPCSTAIYVF